MKKRISLVSIFLFNIFFSTTQLAFAETLLIKEVTDSQSQKNNFVENVETPIFNIGIVSFTNEASEALTEDWWLTYSDQNLNQLITEVSKNNLDSQIAINRMNASFFKARESLAREFPLVNLGTQYSGQKNPKNLSVPAGPSGRPSFPPPIGPRIFAPGQWVNIYSIPLSLNYEPDFFLKNRLRTKSRRLQAEASFFETEQTRLNMTYKATELYFNLMNLEKQIFIQEKIISLINRNLLLKKDLLANGLEEEISVNDTENLLLNNKIQLRNLVNSLEILNTELAFIKGSKPLPHPRHKAAHPHPDHLEHHPQDLISDLSEIDIPKLDKNSFNSELLLNRPDIKLSEKLLAASDIDIKIARRNYLPSFTLALQNSLASVNISNLVSPESLLVAILAGMTQTVFTAGARKAELNLTYEKNHELLNSHSRTILNALKETELSINELSRAEEVLNFSTRQETLAERNLTLMKDKYTQGLISEINLNSDKIEALQVEGFKLDAKTKKLIAFSNLSKTLGGKVAKSSPS